MSPKVSEHRTAMRTDFDQSSMEVDLGGKRLNGQVMDLSEGGMRILIPRNGKITLNEVCSVALGQILPPVRARVRWVSPDNRQGDNLQLGLSFESLLMESRPEEEITRLFEAWEKLSLQYSVFDSYIEMVESLDEKVLDDRVDDLAVLAQTTVWWMEQQLGPLNLWSVVTESDGNFSVSLLVDRGHLAEVGLEERCQRVMDTVKSRGTRWFGEAMYISAPSIVLEFTGESEGRHDVLQRMAKFLGTRMVLWNKILIKNQALSLFGDQADVKRGH